jgi:uncharacterized membrane protein
MASITMRPAGETLLTRAAATWLVVALLGQWAFFAYIAAFYGPSTASGNFEAWNRLAALGAKPFIAGDTRGNLAFAAHALAAGIVALGGALQLMPWIRARFPRFHRINGRVFLATVVALSVSGFYLVWIRKTSTSLQGAIGTTINGVLILMFAMRTYITARARELVVHRRWAMRLYLVSNAQWFTRIGVFAYFVLGKIAGYDISFRDPFFAFWTFGCYLVPLAVLECYLRAKRGNSAVARYAVAGGLFSITLVMLAGMVAFGGFTMLIVSGRPLAMP